MAGRKMLKNSGANFAARFAGAGLNLVSVPVFMRVLGHEAFGVMAFVVAMQSFLSLLDLGLSATISREVAIEKCERRRGDLVSTLAAIYWGMTVVVGVVMAGCAYWASHHWLHLVSLEPSAAWLALSFAGCAVAVRWPVAFYLGVLQGMERQVEANLWSTLFSIVRVLGGLAVACWISPSLNAVFAWQFFTSIVEVVALRRLAIRDLGARRGSFDRTIVADLWRTALGFSAVGALGTITINVDRVLLAHFLPVSELGFYSSIATLTGTLTVIGAAVSSAAFPRLARAARPDAAAGQLAQELQCALRLILWPTIPVCVLLLIAHESILALWLGGNAAENGSGVIIVLVAAALLNACANPFYTAAMAGGHTPFLLRVNLTALILLVPFYLSTLPRWGGIAAAVGVCAQNTILVCGVLWRYRRFFPPRLWVMTRFAEFAICVAVTSAAIYVGGFWGSAWLIAGAGTFATAVLLAIFGVRVPEIRSWISQAPDTGTGRPPAEARPY